MMPSQFHFAAACMSIALTSLASAADSLSQRVDALYQDIEADVINAPTISAESLRQATTAPIWVDARSDRERRVSGISGAISIAELPAALKTEKRLVVVYCTVGYRSGLAVLDLEKQGIAARNLRGGILAWLAAGGQIVDVYGKPTHKVHVYGKSWAVVPEGFEAIY